jgi:hypothetical protein
VIAVPRQYKCKWCGEKDYDNQMVIVQKGKQKIRYHKLNCYPAYLRDQEFKEKERKEKAELYETIMRIHNIEIIPPSFFPFIEDIRNGNILFGKIGSKRYKAGYPYHLIKATYERMEEEILKWKQIKGFKRKIDEMKYALAIVKNYLPDVEEQLEIEKQQQKREEKSRQEVIEDFQEREYFEEIQVAKKDEDDEMDISAFL